MLGTPQENWLIDGLRAVPDRWNFIAQQTLMARARVMVDGNRLLDAIAGNVLGSCIVLSGDAHTAFVCDLKRDFDDEQSAVIAAEFCGTSITSPGRAQTRTDAIVRDNRHILYGDSAHRGYMVLDVTAEKCTARLRVIDNPADRQSAVATAATFVVDAGRPGAHPA